AVGAIVYDFGERRVRVGFAENFRALSVDVDGEDRADGPGRAVPELGLPVQEARRGGPPQVEDASTVIRAQKLDLLEGLERVDGNPAGPVDNDAPCRAGAVR